MAETTVIRSAEDLLKARPLRIVAAQSKYFGATVHFRELTGAAIDLFLNLQLTEDGKSAKVDREYVIGSLQNMLCDPEGQLLFPGPQGREQLQGLAWEGLQELFQLSTQAIGKVEERVAEKKAA